MDDTVFGRGRNNPQEGGPKGIDIDPRGQVLAVTCEFQPLAFFDLNKVSGDRCAPVNRHLRHFRWRIDTVLFNKLGYIARKAA